MGAKNKYMYSGNKIKRDRSKFALGFLWGVASISLLFLTYSGGMELEVERNTVERLQIEHKQEIEKLTYEVTQDTLKRLRENTIKSKDGKNYFAIDMGGVAEKYEIKFIEFMKLDSEEEKNEQ